MLTSPKSALALSDIRFSNGVPFSTVEEHEEALALVRRLAVSAGAAIAVLPLSGINLETLTGGRSGARVFKLTPFYGTNRQLQGLPVVVKIAARAQGTREKENYERFVRPGLPAACRPDLIGFSRTRAYSGLCYSFIGRDDGAALDTLTDWLQRGDVLKVDLVLRRIFDLMRDTWYSPTLLRTEADIARRYFNRYFKGQRSTSETETILRAYAARYFNARYANGRYLIGEHSFPSPETTLFTSGSKRSYLSCILHGDLNSDNIVFTDVAENATGVALIDFQKTGRGHVFEDLIAVEASIRINYARDASLSAIFEKERRIALGQRPLDGDPYSVAIQKIRDAAFQSFGHLEDKVNYHFAVAAIGLRLMHVVDLSDFARARIIASSLWATKALTDEL